MLRAMLLRSAAATVLFLALPAPDSRASADLLISASAPGEAPLAISAAILWNMCGCGRDNGAVGSVERGRAPSITFASASTSAICRRPVGEPIATGVGANGGPSFQVCRAAWQQAVRTAPARVQDLVFHSDGEPMTGQAFDPSRLSPRLLASCGCSAEQVSEVRFAREPPREDGDPGPAWFRSSPDAGIPRASAGTGTFRAGVAAPVCAPHMAQSGVASIRTTNDDGSR